MNIYRILLSIGIFAYGYFASKSLISFQVLDNQYYLVETFVKLLLSYVATVMAYEVVRYHIMPTVIMLYIALCSKDEFHIACIHGDIPGKNRYFIRVGGSNSFAQVKIDLLRIKSGYFVKSSFVSEEFVENEIQQRDRWIMRLGNFVFVNTFE